VKNHALVDGNKRLARLATATFLELNGVTAVDAANDDVYAFVMAAAAAEQDRVEDLSRGLRELCAATGGRWGTRRGR
jgi:death on curing protein